MKWGDCELIYNKKDKRIPYHFHKDLFTYFDAFPAATEENVWLDTTANHFFSAAQTLSKIFQLLASCVCRATLHCFHLQEVPRPCVL